MTRASTVSTAADSALRRSRRDRFAHLRDDLHTYRTVTASAVAVAWCVECQVHHAARVGGLCPVCEPVCEPLRVLTPDLVAPARPEHAAA